MWEFLIQKEGDRTWLPISQPSLTIEEGIYRIVAHSNRSHADVEVRILSQTTENGKSVHHSQQYSRRTNPEGLLMIMPFTELKSGLWELRCCGDILSELIGESWQENVELQVLSKGEIQESNQSETQICKAENYLEQLEQLICKEIEPKLQEFNISYSVSETKNILPTLQLSLDRDSFLRSQGESILISGKIQAIDFNPSEQVTYPLGLKLRYELRDPSGEEICILLEQPLAENNFPITFNYSLEIPNTLEITFLIGEAILIAENQPSPILSRQTFSITTDLSEVSRISPQPINYSIELENIEQNLSLNLDFSRDEQTSPSREKSAIFPPSTSLDLPELTKMNKNMAELQPSSSSILPPKIVRSSDDKKVHKQPELPPLYSPKAKTENLTPTEVNPSIEELIEASIVDEEILLDSELLPLIESVTEEEIEEENLTES
jgi:hypothetical protein